MSALFCCLALGTAAPALAQAGGAIGGEAAAETSAPESSGWQLALTPYLWIPAQDGSVSVKGRSGNIDVDVGETFDAITDNFNFGACMHFEATHGELALFADAMYISLDSEDVPLAEGGTAALGLDQGVFELGAAYAVVNRGRGGPGQGGVGLRLEPLAGARIQYLSGSVHDSFPGNDREDDRAWIDGFVGARGRVSIGSVVALVGRADIGAGMSDLTWSALGGLEFNFAEWASLTVGYRALDTDFNDGHGADEFRYDMLLHGPFLAFTIRF